MVGFGPSDPRSDLRILDTSLTPCTYVQTMNSISCNSSHYQYTGLHHVTGRVHVPAHAVPDTRDEHGTDGMYSTGCVLATECYSHT